MSRSGYTDGSEDDSAANLWRGAVNSAIKGKRGQAFLRELVAALDAMPEKKLYANKFSADGAFCALGVVWHGRGLDMGDLGDDDVGVDRRDVSRAFGVAPALVAEIMYLNDEHFAQEFEWVQVELVGPVRPNWPDYGSHSKWVKQPVQFVPEKRWYAMREWAATNLKNGGQT
jgi:hypothetical protein